jgi:hypothetical protein
MSTNAKTRAVKVPQNERGRVDRILGFATDHESVVGRHYFHVLPHLEVLLRLSRERQLESLMPV